MNPEMLLLLDIGNTHTHIGWARRSRIIRPANLPTAGWFDGTAERQLRAALADAPTSHVALCSVVPPATASVRAALRRLGNLPLFELTARTVSGLGLNYPRPDTIGPDRLANAIAARRLFGDPVLVLDFGTAVTFDVVDPHGCYCGGIIAPGLAAMTDYLHEKTALLPRIRIREVRRAIGRSTEEAMRIGAVHGYRGLVRELLAELKRELRVRRLPVVATGGYAALIAARLPEITAVKPQLTLEGLRLAWENRSARPANAHA